MKLNKAASALGSKGGKAGTGKAKARTTEQARAAAQSRWNKRADRLAQAAGRAAAEIAGDFHAASGRPMTPDEADRVMKLGGEIAKVILRHITEADKQ